MAVQKKGAGVYDYVAMGAGSAGCVVDGISLDALVVVAARRLVLGVDVAAAKFLSGQRIYDPVREQEILESMASRLERAAPRQPLGIEFVRDQIEANKVIQRGLHRYWAEHPEEFPATRRDLTGELRPQFDIVNRHMLLLLIGLKNVPPVRRSDIGALFDRELRTSTVLRPLGELRRDAAGVALRSLYRVLSAQSCTPRR
jgi:chorismate mutase